MYVILTLHDYSDPALESEPHGSKIHNFGKFLLFLLNMHLVFFFIQYHQIKEVLGLALPRSHNPRIMNYLKGVGIVVIMNKVT